MFSFPFLLSCLTNRKQTSTFLHAAQVYSFLFFSIYVLLQLSPYLHSYQTMDVPLNPSENIKYQPIPHSSVCQCLDSVPLLFFAKSPHASLALCARPRTSFLLSLVLLLAGDVELNPGPRAASPPPSHYFNIYCQNTRSVTVINDSINKPEMIQQYIQDNDIDFLFLTETWIYSDSPPSMANSLTPTDYSFLQIPRPAGRGGGIAAIFKSKFSLTSVNTTTFSSFEHVLLRFTCGTKSYLFLIVYLPPICSKATFLSDFSSLLEDLAASPYEFIAIGDFNLHLDDTNDSYSTSFKTLLETFDLKQHISSSTHSSGHTLDLIITKSTSSISSPGVSEFNISDHKAVHCQIPSTVTSPSPSRIKKIIRKISAIDINNFSSDIRASSLYTNPASTLSSFCQQFHSVLSSLLDKHAPPKQIVCRAHPTKPFITPDILLQKKERSRLESIFRLDQSHENESLYKSQAALVHKMVAKSKSSYFKKVIEDNKTKPKKLWKAMDSLLSRNIPKSLPTSCSPSALALSFLNFFNDKIDNLCSSIPAGLLSFNFADNLITTTPPQFSCFDPVTENEVRNIILVLLTLPVLLI